MDELVPVLGRRYKPFEFVGNEQGSHVVVALGSAADQLAAEVLATKRHSNLGVVLVRLYRPFDRERFNDALPKTTKIITVLDQASSSGK